jgi:hypothetical protein
VYLGALRRVEKKKKKEDEIIRGESRKKEDEIMRGKKLS